MKVTKRSIALIILVLVFAPMKFAIPLAVLLFIYSRKKSSRYETEKAGTKGDSEMVFM